MWGKGKKGREGKRHRKDKGRLWKKKWKGIRMETKLEEKSRKGWFSSPLFDKWCVVPVFCCWPAMPGGVRDGPRGARGNACTETLYCHSTMSFCLSTRIKYTRKFMNCREQKTKIGKILVSTHSVCMYSDCYECNFGVTLINPTKTFISFLRWLAAVRCPRGTQGAGLSPGSGCWSPTTGQWKP